MNSGQAKSSPRRLGLVLVLVSMAAFANLRSVRAIGVVFDTTLGKVPMNLLEDDAPATVQNFLNYVLDGDYDSTIFHRTIAFPNPFVLQGGGYKYAGPTQLKPTIVHPTHIPTDPPVVNEFGRSNLYGTVAMARIGGQVNSATSEWYFNLADNTTLDTADEGFTVFAEVIWEGMDVVNLLAYAPSWNIGGNFTDLPLQGIVPDLTHLTDDNYLLINRASLLGDLNFDGVVGLVDANVVSTHWGTALELADANFDGVVDIFDIAVISNFWFEGRTLVTTNTMPIETAALEAEAPAANLLDAEVAAESIEAGERDVDWACGDANFDGIVDIFDVAAISNRLGATENQASDPAAGSAFAIGADVVSNNWGAPSAADESLYLSNVPTELTGPTSAVPEPGATALAALGACGVAIARIRRRCRR